MSTLHVVLGASGGAGYATVQALCAEGQTVRAVSRNGGTFPAGVEVVKADLSDPVQARRACQGAAVVYHCANPAYHTWPQTLLPLADGVLAGAADAGARLVVMDNLYMYGPPQGPMAETHPRAATGMKGRLRIQMEEHLLRAHAQGRAPVAIARASDFYGPRCNSVGNKLGLEPALAGKPGTWLGTLDAPHSHSFIGDVGRSLATLGAHDAAFGEVWHLPAGPPATGRAFLLAAFAAVGQPARLKSMPYSVLWLGGLFNPTIREIRETFYQFQAPFVMDTTKFERAFAPTITPLAEGLRQTVAWYRAQAGR